MPIDWGSRETMFRLLAATFAAIGKEGVSKSMHSLHSGESISITLCPMGWYWIDVHHSSLNSLANELT
jgi:hypothetical protein